HRPGRHHRLLGRAALWPSRLHDRGAAGAAADPVRRAQSAPGRGRLHPDQRTVDSGPGEVRLLPRGSGAPLPLHQWGLAGPSAVRPAARGFPRLTKPKVCGLWSALLPWVRRFWRYNPLLTRRSAWGFVTEYWLSW